MFWLRNKTPILVEEIEPVGKKASKVRQLHNGKIKIVNAEKLVEKLKEPKIKGI